MNPPKIRGVTSTTGVGRVGVGKVSSSSDVVLSKMINDRSGTAFTTPAAGLYSSDALLDITAERQANNLDDYENILLTQPDLELPIQILISSILSPKAANKITLKHSLKPNGLPVELTNSLLQSAKNCVENVYMIKDGLADKLRKAIFTQGSVTTLILGEAAIDDVINGNLKGLNVATESLRKRTISQTVESATRPRGYLGDSVEPNAVNMGLESILDAASRSDVVNPTNRIMNVGDFTKIPGWVSPTIEDNPAILGLGMALETMLEEKRQVLHGLHHGSSLASIDRLYHDIKGGIQETVILPRPGETSRKSLTRPVRRPVPPEAVTVVFQPGNPKHHLGYLLLTDQTGGFANRKTRREYWRNVGGVLGGNREVVSQMLSKAADSTSTKNQDDTMLAMAASAHFREMAIQDIERRMMNGSIGEGTVADKEAFFNLMFELALSGRQTRVLYVPVDMVSYWAYRYNDDGSGRSMLEDNKFLAGIRSMLTVANTETALRNSIDYTKLGITLDPNDPNKTRTKELIIDQYVRNRLRSTPWNTTNPRRIIEMMQMAGVSIDIDGGDNYPGTKVNITREDIQQREVNMELDESIFRRLMMGFGIAPEIVDLSTQIEFSSKMITSNELSLKRVIVLQDVTNFLCRQEVIKTFLSDPIQMDEFREIVREFVGNMDGTDEEKAGVNVNQLINIFLGAYDINLPRPENGLDADIAEFETYMTGVDKVLETVYNEEVLGEMDNSELSNQYKRMVAVVRQYKAMQWMADHDFMPEVLKDLKQVDEKDIPGIVTETMTHYRQFNGLIMSLIPRMVAQNVSDSEKLQALMENLEEQRVKTEGAGNLSGGETNELSGSSEDGGLEGGGGSEDDLFGKGLPAGGGTDANADDLDEEPAETPAGKEGGEAAGTGSQEPAEEEPKPE